MHFKGRRCLFAGITIAGWLIMSAAVSAQAAPAQSPSKPRTTDEAFKNIQVLKGIPADQLIPTMQFIAASLGVECDFCHVQGAFEKDEKKTKQTARQMMQMLFAINRDNFNGSREVSCYSCHRGNPKPVSIPVISEEQPVLAPETAEKNEQAAPKLPTVNQVLEKYLAALGGAAAIRNLNTRVETGTATIGSHHVAVEIFAKAPDQRISVVHMPEGDSVTAFDGQSGWLAVPGRPLRDMGSGDVEAARLDADLHFPVRIQEIFPELHLDADKIGDREVYRITGVREGLPPVKLYFDEQSGLLLRMVRYLQTPLGLNPTQIDYADYRESGGAKTPFRWTIARPGGRFTIQVEQARANVPIDDKKFAKPAQVPKL